MICANEAKKISKENNSHAAKLRKTIEEKILPIIDFEIRSSCAYGGTGIIIKRNVITEANDDYYYSSIEVINAVAQEIKEYGYKVSIPQSYSSIHIDW